MNRSTGIGWLFRRDPARAAEELRETYAAVAGDLTAAAAQLGITRRHLYRLTTRANLWDDVDAMRRQRRAIPDDIARARAALAD